MREIPASLQTTYANLLQAHLSQPTFDFDGAPFTLEKRGRLFWYVNQRGVGSAAPRQRYLGPDTEEMRVRAEAMRSQKTDRDTFRNNSSRMVAQLRAGGVPGLDRQTGTALRALVRSGVFRLGGTLVGTQAFRHYDLELGVVLAGEDPEDQLLRETMDMDIAVFNRLSDSIEDEADPDISKTLTALGYKARATLDRGHRSTSWRHANSAYDIDFLTPSFDEREDATLLKSLNVWAQGLHYLSFLIADPMPAVSIYMEGLLVQVPRPERFAVHKLIVSQRRRAGSSVKARKDVQQARAIIHALADTRPYELNAALAEATSKGKAWKSALDAAMTVEFRSPVLKYDFNRDIVWFEGETLGQKHRCAISSEALHDHFQTAAASPADYMDAVRSNRSRIEALMNRKFRAAPSRETLLTTDDI